MRTFVIKTDKEFEVLAQAIKTMAEIEGERAVVDEFTNDQTGQVDKDELNEQINKALTLAALKERIENME